MSLKYYMANNSIREENPKESYYSDYDAILDFSFDNAPNVVYDEIEYEETYGKNNFVKISRVRVDTVLDYNTGIILGDDYKTFIFAPEFKITPYYGMKFRWKDNYWLVINTNSYASVPNTAEVRRCNNVLRFFDSHGERVFEPCIMDYTLRFANNQETSIITVGSGEQKIWCQRNPLTSLIESNQRFLFGSPTQRVCFRVYGGGIKNYLNSSTMDDNSPTLSEMYVEHYEINPLFDDLENGFADAYLNEIRVEIMETDSINLNVGDSKLLNAIAYKGKEIIPDVEIAWETSNSRVISIENNEAKAISLGSAIIKAKIVGTNIKDVLKLNVVDSEIEDNYEIVIEPNIDYVLQNKSKQFSVYLYKNGEKQNNSFDFINETVDVPISSYNIVVNDENHFTINNNKMFMKNPVIIKCVTGEYSKNININLRGLY